MKEHINDFNSFASLNLQGLDYKELQPLVPMSLFVELKFAYAQKNDGLLQVQL